MPGRSDTRQLRFSIGTKSSRKDGTTTSVSVTTSRRSPGVHVPKDVGRYDSGCGVPTHHPSFPIKVFREDDPYERRTVLGLSHVDGRGPSPTLQSSCGSYVPVETQTTLYLHLCLSRPSLSPMSPRFPSPARGPSPVPRVGRVDPVCRAPRLPLLALSCELRTGCGET